MLVALTPDDDVYAELYNDGVADIVAVRVVDQSSPSPPGSPRPQCCRLGHVPDPRQIEGFMDAATRPRYGQVHGLL